MNHFVKIAFVLIIIPLFLPNDGWAESSAASLSVQVSSHTGVNIRPCGSRSWAVLPCPVELTNADWEDTVTLTNPTTSTSATGFLLTSISNRGNPEWVDLSIRSDTCFGISLRPGESCTFNLFTESMLTNYSATVTITAGKIADSTISVTGTP